MKSLKRSLHIPKQRFNFDTYKLVRQLEAKGITRSQAVALMTCMNSLLAFHSSNFSTCCTSAVGLENQDYIWKSRVQVVRGELQDLRTNDASNLKVWLRHKDDLLDNI